MKNIKAGAWRFVWVVENPGAFVLFPRLIHTVGEGEELNHTISSYDIVSDRDEV